MATLDEILRDADRKMDASVEKVQEDFASIRTGRASPQLLHNVMVDYYGQRTPLQQLATFAVPEPRMLVVNPYDKGAMDDIERAIRDGDLGLNPASDGQIIRCVFPELTEERRREYIKLAKEKGEDGKIAIRNVRRSAKDEMQALEDDGDVGADEHTRYAKQLEELTAKHVNRIDELLDHKEKDLLAV